METKGNKKKSFCLKIQLKNKFGNCESWYYSRGWTKDGTLEIFKFIRIGMVYIWTIDILG